jgi:repressor LexA
LPPETDPAMQPDMRRIGKRVRELREKLSMDQKNFGGLIGVDQATISRWEHDRQTPEGEALLSLSRLAQTSVEEFLGTAELRPAFLEGVRLMGKVQAGDWVEAWEYPKEDQAEISVIQNEKFRGIQRFGLEVCGPSMNQIYPERTIIICARVEDLGRDPVHGERVIVERKRSDGLIEMTCKEFVIDPASGKAWLWPRSNQPEYAQPIPIPEPETGNGIEAVRIIAIVTGSYRNE